MENSKARLFIMFEFQKDTSLPDFLTLITKNFGKYDYFTQNIKIRAATPGSFQWLRVFSFKEKIEILKIRKVIKKLDKIRKVMYEKKHDNFQIFYGYTSLNQVVLTETVGSKWNILSGKEVYSLLQLIYDENRWLEQGRILEEFKIPEVKLFFHDLRRFTVTE